MKISPIFSGITLSLALLASSALAQAQATSNAATTGAAATATPAQPETAIFAGGCFWCTESDFEKLPGVVKAESGYIAGQVENPTYEQVSAGTTGHTEAVRVYYDPSKISYVKLVDFFWHTIDPTVKDQQFCDIGSQYRSGIYFLNDAQRQAAEASLAALQKSGRFEKIHTEVIPATTFYLAENYHQDYYKKNPVRYRFYRTSCGRDARLAELWGAK